MTPNLPTLPAGWELKKLGDVVTEISSKLQAHQCQDLPYLSLENIESQTGKLLNVSTAKESNVIGTCSRFTKDTVIYSKLRPYLNKVAIPDFDGVGTTELIVFQPKDNLDKIFLANFLRSESVVSIINASSYGAKMPRTSSKFLKELEIPLPPLDEQKRLVALLDTLFAKIDRSIELLSENIAAADLLLPSALNTVFGELKEIWEIVNLPKLVKINSGIALPAIFKDKEKFDGGDIPFYKVAQMNNHDSLMTTADLYFNADIAKRENIKIFPKGSILLPKRGGAILTNKKRMMTIDASYDSNVMGLKANNELLSDEFLFAFLQSLDLSNFIDTSTIPQINNKHIELMAIPLPPLDIQSQTVAYLDSIRTKVEILKQVQNDKITHLKALKASILDRAFKGEL